MVDRHDDELAERRATARPRRERAAGGGALPLQWADPPEEPVTEDTRETYLPPPTRDLPPPTQTGSFVAGGEEADSDAAPD